MDMSLFHAPIPLFHRIESSVSTEQGAAWSLDLVLTFFKKTRFTLPITYPRCLGPSGHHSHNWLKHNDMLVISYFRNRVYCIMLVLCNCISPREDMSDTILLVT